ncbi:MAG: hypothetical protein Q4E91_05040 [Lachnospiraceae bacterium]|nr:hypothetical protein [Lachnospiraceae bacterium]
MRTGLKKGLVLGISACMALTSLAGCGKKEGLDSAAAVATLDGEEVSVGAVNFMLRYEQAQFDSSYGSFLKSYYGDIWNSDLTGTGETYGETFKDQIMNTMERLLLAEKHMADYQVELTDEEKAAITQAASDFIASNDEEVLEKMSATQENVERILTLRTIQTKMETEMCADVDTEVSDEEAAQRTVSYVRFALDREEETEEETEASTDSEAESSEEETAAAQTEEETEASLTEEATAKTGSADTEAETEASEETEAAAGETEAETAAEADTEAVSEEETETETEDEATIQAKAEAKAKAEAFLEQVKEQDDFAAAAEEIADADDNVSTSSFTFGDDDTYPDETIISVTKGLEDDTLVDEVVEVGDSYYVLHVDDAFDEEATADKKEEIVNTRKQEAIDALYEEWMEGVEFTVDEEVYGKLVFDMELMIETEGSDGTEAETEAASEAGTEAVTEGAGETETETIAESE